MAARYLLLILVAYALPGCSRSARQELPDNSTSSLTGDMNAANGIGRVCRVVFDVAADSGTTVEFVIASDSLIEDLVLVPLASPRHADSRLDYIIVGHLRVEANGQVTDQALLYLPFGIVEYRGQVLSVDFDKLRRHLLKYATVTNDILAIEPGTGLPE